MTENLRRVSIDCLATIEQRLPTLGGTARRVAAVIVDDPWAVLGMTIYEVADRSEVSVPSVTRFCRAVGYAGYRELTRGLAQSLGRLDSRDLETLKPSAGGADHLRSLAEQIVERQSHALRVAATTIDMQVIEAIVGAMMHVPRVTVIGHGAAYSTVIGTAVKLNWAGVPAFAATPDMFSNQAMCVGEGDVIVGISHQGRTRDVIEALRLSQRLGATTVGVSTVANAPLAQVSHHFLAVLSAEIVRSGTFMVAYNALMLAADLIAAAISERRFEGAPPNRGDVSEWIESHFRVGPVVATAEKDRVGPESQPSTTPEETRHG